MAMLKIVETDIPARLDRLPWGRFHTRVVVARIVAGSCACAASDQAAATPPNRVMNSRRLLSDMGYPSQRVRRIVSLPMTAGGDIYFCRQLFANAAIAASRVAS